MFSLVDFVLLFIILLFYGDEMMKLVRRGLKTGPIESSIREKLLKEFKPTHLLLLNESKNHGLRHGAESHFNVTIVRHGLLL